MPLSHSTIITAITLTNNPPTFDIIAMMKLISWNVNGLRSTENQFLNFINEFHPDVLMLQEIRATPDQLSFFLKLIPGYEVEFNPSGRSGYGGTAVYYKQSIPFEMITTSTGDETLDSEGRTILCTINNLSIFNFYTPNGNNNQERLKYKLRFYNSISEYMQGLLSDRKPVIIGGDLNVAHTELDIYNPKASRISGFLPVERKWFSNMLDLGFTDSFRMFEKGGGYYSWWHMRDPKREMNRGWRFDYFLVSKSIKRKVKSAGILRDIYGSDHCPVSLEIDI